MKKYTLVGLLVMLAVITTGCIQFRRGSNVNSGVFKSFDAGSSWQQKGLLVITGGVSTVASMNITDLYFDPSDNNAMYATVQGSGLLYTYNGGENWTQPKQLTSGNITSVAIDPRNKCTIYVALEKRILKSVDCNRSYEEVYLDSRDVQIQSLAISPDNSSRVYAGTSKGDFIRSADGGGSWNTLFNLRSSLDKIVIDPAQTSVIYAALQNGISKTTDGGFSWESLNDGLKKYSGGTQVIDLIMNPSRPGSLILLNRYGLLKTQNAGASWEPYNLITPPLSTKIYAVAVNPKNDQDIYYGTASTFYKSQDGGENWIVKRLPSQARTSAVLVDPVNPSVVYLGTLVEKQ